MPRIRLITAFNETKTLTNWIKDPRCVISYGTAWARIIRNNWPPEEAFTTPVRPRRTP